MLHIPLLLALVVGSAHPQKTTRTETEGWRGLRWGMMIADVKNALLALDARWIGREEWMGGDVGGVLKDYAVAVNEPLGSARIIRIECMFWDTWKRRTRVPGPLWLVKLRFAEEQGGYDDLLTALIDKYGAPHSTRNSGSIVVWRQRHTVIELLGSRDEGPRELSYVDARRNDEVMRTSKQYRP